MIVANQMTGCIYYAFSQDLTDPNTFHLLEGWADREAYERHEESEIFLKALSTVVREVRIVDRQGVRYNISSIEIDDPRGKV
jgi:quinol monooxygenase YgiN